MFNGIPSPHFKLRNFKDLTKTFHLEKSAVCDMDIQNYNSNYMNRRSIITYITIIIIKIIKCFFAI